MGFSLATAGNSVVLVAVIVGFFGFLGPIVVDWNRQRARSRERQEDRKERAAVAGQAAAAARALSESNDKIAKAAKAVEEKTMEQLNLIHGAVNSNLTQAIRDSLDSSVRELASLKELIELRRAQGQEPSVEALATIETTEARIIELRHKLADRAVPPDAQA